MPEDITQNMGVHVVITGKNMTRNMFRSYNNCYYFSSEPVTDEEDELTTKYFIRIYNSVEVNKISTVGKQLKKSGHIHVSETERINTGRIIKKYLRTLNLFLCGLGNKSIDLARVFEI